MKVCHNPIKPDKIRLAIQFQLSIIFRLPTVLYMALNLGPLFLRYLLLSYAYIVRQTSSQGGHVLQRKLDS